MPSGDLHHRQRQPAQGLPQQRRAGASGQIGVEAVEVEARSPACACADDAEYDLPKRDRGTLLEAQMLTAPGKRNHMRYHFGPTNVAAGDSRWWSRPPDSLVVRLGRVTVSC